MQKLIMAALVVPALLYFFVRVLISTVTHRSMFSLDRKFARRHRMAGLLLLLWHCFGFLGLLLHAFFGAISPYLFISPFCYDVVLGLLGSITTITAASDFEKAHCSAPEANMKAKKSSGTLDEDATVTHSEMVEHSFYQGLNLLQALYLHAVDHAIPSHIARSIGLRSGSEIFQDNYNKGQYSWSLISIMYRTKKYQYVFYKHWLLHAFNLSIALDGGQQGFTARDMAWRLYWGCLNLSYVMEFFLQTLVKKRHIAQATMLALQQALMLASSAAAVRALWHVRQPLALLSLALNFTRRGRELENFVLVMVASLALSRFLS